MTPTFDKIHTRFKLNAIHYDFEELKEVAYSLIKEGVPFEKNMGDFLLDWLNHDNYITVKTSGSTGLPKPMKVKKQAMVNSAIATGNYFNMEPGDSALLCLPTHYIAGKMMLVRAMILGLELDFVEPNSHPVFDYGKPYDFCAMIPLQVQNQLNYLNNIKTLIVGGASISKALESKIQDLNTHVFATYGMTETVTHIAVKALNGKKKMQHFNVFPKVKISTDERNCLVIEAPHLSADKVITNDIVTLVSDTEFDIIGRIDNMVNSGGVKLFPERIEAKLELKIKERFFIASEKDEKLGQKLILLLESQTNTIKPSVFKELDKFEIPKTIYTIPKFVYTVTGKIQRQETLKLLK